MNYLNKVEQQAECIACPWNKFCIQPPAMTEEQVKAEMEEIKQPQEEGDRGLAASMLKAMFVAGKDREATVCPVFANVLRASPELSQKIKSIMRGEESEAK